MSLIRKIKISKLTNIPLSKEELELINYYDSIFSDLKKFKRWDSNSNNFIVNSSNSTYYLNSKGKLILDYESGYREGGILWINPKNIFNKTLHFLNIYETEIIAYFTYKHIKLKFSRIMSLNNTSIIKLIEDEFKQKN